jgi:two-component system, chemotaxis family, response regulator Rcp1
MNNEAKPVPVILLVEDNEDDVVITNLGFRRTGRKIDLQHVSDGNRCLAYLRREGSYADAPIPDMVLLDLNMPGMDGRAVLSAIVSDPHLCHLPVVIFTTSDYEGDILDCYRLRCSSYVTKPVDLNALTETLTDMLDYWFALVERPELRNT